MTEKEGYRLGIFLGLLIVIIIKIGIAIYDNIYKDANLENNYSAENEINIEEANSDIVELENNKKDNEQFTQTEDEKNTDEIPINQEATEKLKDYFYHNFGGNGDDALATSWYSLIKNITVYSEDDYYWAVIDTHIYNDEEGKEAASSIANAILFWDEIKISTIKINGKDGLTLLVKENLR